MALLRSTPTNSLPTRRLVAYSMPAVPLAILFVPVITYLPVFYSTEAGLSLSVVGAIFMIARIGDALIDPLVGAMTDATRSRFGRRRIWLAGAVVPLMLATYFLCNPPAQPSAAYLLWWVVVFYLTWSAVQVPYLSWGAELDRNYHGRSRVFGFRETGTFVGIMLGTGLPVLFAGQDAPLARVLAIISTAALITLPLAVIAAAMLVGEPSSRRSPLKPEWNGLLWALRINPPYVRLLTFTVLNYTFINMFNATIVLLVARNLQLPDAFLVLVFIQYAATSFIFIPFVLLLCRSIGRHRVLALGNLCGAIVVGGLGVIPAGNYGLAIVAFALLGFVSAAVWALPPAMVADVADYGALRGQEGGEGIYMAGYNLAVKAGTGIGIGIALPLLQALGLQTTANMASTPSDALAIVGCWLPALCMALVSMMMWRFPIDQHLHASIRRRLDRRRGLSQVLTAHTES